MSCSPPSWDFPQDLNMTKCETKKKSYKNKNPHKSLKPMILPIFKVEENVMDITSPPYQEDMCWHECLIFHSRQIEKAY